MPETDAEIEQSRQEALADLDKDMLANFAPGSMGCHEALHTAWIMVDTFDRHLLTHPAVVLNPDWYRRASRAHTELFELYQDIGAAEPETNVRPLRRPR
jgi:hypothetical protein